MLPTAFEFRWDIGHIIFFGAFYSVVAVVLTSLSYVMIKSIMDVYKEMSGGDRQISGSETLGDSEEQGETDQSAQDAATETRGESGLAQGKEE